MSDPTRGVVPVWGRAASFASFYIVLAMIGRTVALPPGPSVAFWLPGGLFVAVLLRNDYRHWPVFILASCAANLGFDLWNGQPAHVSALFWCGNVMEAVTGAWLVRRLVTEYPDLSSVREVAGLVLASAIVGTALSATVGSAVVTRLVGSGSFWGTWLVWWSNDAVGVLLAAPLVLALSRPFRWPRWRPGLKDAEIAIFGIALMTTIVVVFQDAWHRNANANHFLIPFLIWAAFRFGIGGTALTSMTIGVAASWFAARGAHQPGSEGMSLADQVVALQAFIVVFATTGLFLAAIVSERRRAEAAQRGANARLKAIFEGARDPIVIANVENGNVIDANEAAARLFNRPKDALIGLHQSQLHPPEEAEHYRLRFKTRVDAPSSPHLEAVACSSDGRRIPVEISTDRITLEDGTQAVVGIFRDITERMRADRIKRARLRLLEFAASHTLEELLVATLDEVEVLTGSEVGFYDFLEADQKTLSLQAWSTRTLKKMCQAEGKGLHYDVAEAGVWADCIRQRQAVIHNDYAALTHRKGFPDGHAPVARELVVPVFRGDQIVAILGTGNKPDEYTDDDVQTVSQLANLAWDVAERKRAEEALRRTTERLELAQRSAGVGIWDWDMPSGRLDWSPKLFQLLGLDANHAEATFDTWRAALHPEDIAAASDRISQAVRDHATLESEYRVVYPSGEIRWISALGNATYGRDGEPLRMSGICLDITERRKTEDALRASEAILRSLFDAITESVFMVDLDGVILAANRTFGERMGCPAEDCVGRCVFDLLPPDVAARRRAWIEDVRRTGGPVTLEDQRADHWMTSSLCPVHAPDGTVDRLVIFAADTTSRKRVEHALLQSQVELKAIYDHAPVMMCVLDEDREVQYVNRAFEAFIGKPVAEMPQLKACGVLGCVHALDDARGCGFGPDCAACTMRAALSDTLRTGVSHTGVEYRTTLVRDDARREVTLLGSTARIQTPREALLLLCLTDITEEKRAEEALVASRAELKALSRRLVALDEQNRRELARELHDRVGQNLTALNLNFTVMQGLLPPSPPSGFVGASTILSSC